MRGSDISPIRAAADQGSSDDQTKSRNTIEKIPFEKSSSGLAQDFEHLIPISEEQTTFLEKSAQRSIAKHKTEYDVNNNQGQRIVEAEVRANPAKMFDALASNLATPESTSLLSLELNH